LVVNVMDINIADDAGFIDDKNRPLGLAFFLDEDII